MSIRYCVDCGNGIPSQRIQLIPTAVRCISCESQYENIHNDQVSKCPYCSVFVRTTGLKKHIELVHQLVTDQELLVENGKSESIKCPHCDSFFKPKNLQRHMDKAHSKTISTLPKFIKSKCKRSYLPSRVADWACKKLGITALSEDFGPEQFMAIPEVVTDSVNWLRLVSKLGNEEHDALKAWLGCSLSAYDREQDAKSAAIKGVGSKVSKHCQAIIKLVGDQPDGSDLSALGVAIARLMDDFGIPKEPIFTVRGKETTQSPIAKPVVELQPLMRKDPRPLATKQSSTRYSSCTVLDEQIDGSKGWHTFRDQGCFGSHPMFDSMDDESTS